MSQPTPRYRHGIMATLCLPWNEDYTLNEELLCWQVRHLMANGVKDLYLFGTAGEGHAVTESQFDEATKVFLDVTKEGADVQALIGIITMSLPTAIERIERCLDMGVTRFQISLPSWGALNDAELECFFAETCGRFPQAEFMHYNLMRTHRLVTPEEYARLADQYPNLVATKNSTKDMDRLKGLMTLAPQLRHFITEGGFPDAAMMGPCGFLLSIASVKPELARAYFAAGVRLDAATLNSMRAELAEMSLLLRESMAGEAHMDGAFDKIFCKIHDPRFPLRLLKPYVSSSERAFQAFADGLKAKFPRWA